MGKKHIIPDWEDMYGGDESKEESTQDKLFQDLTVKELINLVTQYGLVVTIKVVNGEGIVTIGGEKTIYITENMKKEKEDEEVYPIIHRPYNRNEDKERFVKLW